MSMQLDPEQNETAALLQACGDLTGKRVLEVGSGEGRLTWRYAHRTASVTALEPDPVKLHQARADLPDELRAGVIFFAGSLEEFAARKRRRFDLAILSWSL